MYPISVYKSTKLNPDYRLPWPLLQAVSEFANKYPEGFVDIFVINHAALQFKEIWGQSKDESKYA